MQVKDLQKQLELLTPPSDFSEIAPALAEYWDNRIWLWDGDTKADTPPPPPLLAHLSGAATPQYLVQEKGIGIFLAADMEQSFLCCDLHMLGVFLCTIALPCKPLPSQKDIDLAMTLCLWVLRGLSENSAIENLLGTPPDLFLSQQDGELREIYCLYCDCRTLSPRQAALLCAQVEERLPVLHIYRTAEGFSVLCSGTAQALENLEDFLRDVGVHAGLCGPFERAASAQGCLQKASLSACIGSRAASVSFLHSFSALRHTALCQAAEDALCREKLCIQDFCHGALRRILSFDRERGSEYYSTLSHYLRCGRNLKEAAAILGVHRNTLAYRIGRIASLFGLDLNDTNTCFELLFSFRMYENPIFHIQNETPMATPTYRSRLEAVEDARMLWAALHAPANLRFAQEPCHASALLMVDAGPLSDAERRMLIARCRSLKNGIAFAMEDDALYFLAACDEEERNSMLEAFGGILKAARCAGAASQLFPANAICKHMRLTKLSLRASSELGLKDGLLRMEDYCSIIFFLFLQQHFPLSPYYCDEVIRVLDHDFEKGSDLAKSLYVYLASFMDMKDAAQEVSIHRNTLEYQLKKIETLLGGKSFDEHLRFEMMCTYRMLTVAGQDF